MGKLYNNLLPALKSKIKDLHNEGYTCITTRDIFNYLKDFWDKSTNICDMVDDIMCVDGLKISKSLGNEVYRRSLYEKK